MIIRATTPNRIDLAGGTLDIWPLYAFLGGGYTVNAAVNLGSEVTIETRPDHKFDLYSEDLKTGLTADSLADLEPDGTMDLVVRALKHYRPSVGLNIRTHNKAPKGTGLGSSSALLIALGGALFALESKAVDKQHLIDTSADIEAMLIGIPTGKQDYYAAAYGGVNAIWFGHGANRVEPLVVEDEVRQVLDERLILTFTGETRFSGTSNWNMIKAYIENTGDTRHHLAAIARTSHAVRDALLAADFDAFARALAEEWQNRKSLAEGVTTPRIDELMEKAAAAGALASKICGAGGGGCMISFCAPSRRQSVIAALVGAGAVHLAYSVRMQGLDVTCS